MAWIRTISMEEADEELSRLMVRHRELYPVEYSSPVSPGGASIVASHSLMPDALGRRAREERRLVSARLISYDFICRPTTTQLEGLYAASAENRIGIIAPIPAFVRRVLHRHAPEPGSF